MLNYDHCITEVVSYCGALKHAAGELDQLSSEVVGKNFCKHLQVYMDKAGGHFEYFV